MTVSNINTNNRASVTFRNLFFIAAISFSIVLNCHADDSAELDHLEKAWQHAEKHELKQAEDMMRDLPDEKYHNDKLLVRAEMNMANSDTWSTDEIKQAIQMASQIRTFFDQRYSALVEKRCNGMTLDMKDQHDELQYVRLHMLLGTLKYQFKLINSSKESPVYSDEEIETDLLALRYWLSRKTFQKIDYNALLGLAATETQLGKNEQALGYLLLLHFLYGKQGGDEWRKKGLPPEGVETLMEYARLVEYSIACKFAKMNMVEEAVAWLKKSLQTNPERLWPSILADTDLENVRQDSRFKEMFAARKAGVH